MLIGYEAINEHVLVTPFSAEILSEVVPKK